MNLLASFFFSAIIYNTLKQDTTGASPERGTTAVQDFLKSECDRRRPIAFDLCGILPCRFLSCLCAADHRSRGAFRSADIKDPGPYAGVVASATIALACLTTAIALAAVSAGFLQQSIFRNKISYIQALLMTLGVGFAVSLLEFTGIVSLLSPFLQIAYPALIVFTIYNIFSCLRTLKAATA